MARGFIGKMGCWWLPTADDCLLALPHIKEMNWDATFHGIQTALFDRRMTHDFETGTVGHLGELIVKRTDSSMYPEVEREPRHEGSYVAWKANHPRVMFTSC